MRCDITMMTDNRITTLCMTVCVLVGWLVMISFDPRQQMSGTCRYTLQPTVFFLDLYSLSGCGRSAACLCMLHLITTCTKILVYDAAAHVYRPTLSRYQEKTKSRPKSITGVVVNVVVIRCLSWDSSWCNNITKSFSVHRRLLLAALCERSTRDPQLKSMPHGLLTGPWTRVACTDPNLSVFSSVPDETRWRCRHELCRVGGRKCNERVSVGDAIREVRRD